MIKTWLNYSEESCFIKLKWKVCCFDRTRVKDLALHNFVAFFLTFLLSLYRYEYLDRYIRVRLELQPKSFKFVAAKVAADGLLFGPLDLLLFFSYMGFASGRSANQVKEDVKRDFLPALIVGGAVWPFVQVANFRFVPVRYQLLYVNFFCLLDSSFLSWIEQQGDAPWKQWFSSIGNLEKQKGQAWWFSLIFVFLTVNLPFIPIKMQIHAEIHV